MTYIKPKKTMIVRYSYKWLLSLSIIKINCGKDVGTYYFDNVSGLIEDSLSMEKDKREKNAVVLYPNPVSDILYIKGYTEIGTVDLYTTTGKLIQVFELQDGKMNVSDIQEGICIYAYR